MSSQTPADAPRTLTATLLTALLALVFGFLGAAVMTPDEARTKIKAVREGTDRPFGVNLRADAADVGR